MARHPLGDVLAVALAARRVPLVGQGEQLERLAGAEQGGGQPGGVAEVDVLVEHAVDDEQRRRGAARRAVRTDESR